MTIHYVLISVGHIANTPDDAIKYYGVSGISWRWSEDIHDAKLFPTRQTAENEKWGLEQLGETDIQIRMIRR
jgi:hypothetical protein